MRQPSRDREATEGERPDLTAVGLLRLYMSRRVPVLLLVERVVARSA